MNTSSSAANEDEIILAELVGELEKHGSVVLDEYVRRYPHLADKIRELVRLQQAVEESRPEGKTTVPARLGDFRIGRKIASGGMGDIYEAVQESLKRRVAVKIIRRGRLSPLACERFLREQQVLAQLHQTHIVPIHTAGEEGPLQYFAMPYIEGAALHHVIRVASQFGASQTGSKTPPLAKLAGMATSDPEWQPQDFTANPERAVSTHEQQDSSSTQSDRGKPDAGREPPGRRMRQLLSPDYFRSVAQVMADAADAVHHAHSYHILHRDVKPSNIMVDTSEQCWLIDFGLAGYRRNEETAEELKGGPVLGSDPATISGILGTPGYMAPEQFASRADVRTDVWGLGVTLYELLTLRRAFGDSAGSKFDLVRRPLPPPPGELIRNVPRDLSAISLKAVQHEPGQRYQTAAAFGDDLRCWLRGEPTRARPGWVGRRVWLWAQRNRGWAAALTCLLVAFLALTWATVSSERNKVAIAEAEGQSRHRESIVQQIERLRLTPHVGTWREEALAQVRKAAEIRKDAELQTLAANLLRGLEVRLIKSIAGEASSVAFDATGDKLLMGGAERRSREGNIEKSEAQLWERRTDHKSLSGLPGAGPVTFRPDGIPLQFAKDPHDAWTLVLWDVRRKQLLRRFALPRDVQPGDPKQPVVHDLAMTPDGARVAAAVVLPGDKSLILIWETAAGALVQILLARIQVLALAPDGSLVAGGDDKGTISIWSLPKGQPAATLRRARSGIQCLAFARDPCRYAGAKGGDKFPGWLLASGDDGGTVAVWDLGTQLIRTSCRGSQHEILAVAFSPDGATLASSGRYFMHLWDVATGRSLLEIDAGEFVHALTFSHDGKRLATCSGEGFGHEVRVIDWEVRNGRGMRELRGLETVVSKLCYSADGRRIAALAHNWQIAVWDTDSGFLRHVLEPPRGWTADNASLAFSPDGQRLAFATGVAATLWDLDSGEQFSSWKLPLGMTDTLVFRGGDHLLLCRQEKQGGEPGVFDEEGWKRGPRVCMIRDLLAKGPVQKPIREIVGFYDVNHILAAPGGTYFLIEGRPDPHTKHRNLKAFDSATGRELWSKEFGDRPDPEPSVYPAFDPTGGLLALSDLGHHSSPMLVEMPSGKLLETWEFREGIDCHCLGPNAVLSASNNSLRVRLYCRHKTEPLITLATDSSAHALCFNKAGTQLLWNSDAGSVIVCELQEVQEQLAAFGLGW